MGTTLLIIEVFESQSLFLQFDIRASLFLIKKSKMVVIFVLCSVIGVLVSNVSCLTLPSSPNAVSKSTQQVRPTEGDAVSNAEVTAVFYRSHNLGFVGFGENDIGSSKGHQQSQVSWAECIEFCATKRAEGACGGACDGIIYYYPNNLCNCWAGDSTHKERTDMLHYKFF